MVIGLSAVPAFTPTMPNRSIPSVLRFAVLAAVLVAGCRAAPEVRKQQFFESGNRYFDEGKYSHAVIEYRNAVAIDGAFGAARARLAEAYARSGDGRRALGEYVRAADLLPADAGIQLTAGTYLLAARKPEDALARADAALKLKPEDVQAQVLRGNALAGLSSFDEALKAIEEAIRLDPVRGATYTNLGMVELARGKRSEAEAAFVRAVALSPKTVEPHLALGNFYWAVGRTSDAQKAFQAALVIEPANVAANRISAALAISTGRPNEAEPYLQKIADSSDDPSGTLVLAEYYLLAGRPKDAIARLDGLVASGRDVPGVGARRARAFAAAGDPTKAKAIVEEVLKARPADAEAQLLKGQLLLQDGRRDDALAVIKDAATKNPSSAEAQFALGRLYAARGDHSAAETAFQEVLRINPRATRAQVELAGLQIAAGKPNESVRTAEDAARTQPKDIAARLTLVRSLMAAKDLVRAERELSGLQADHPDRPEVLIQTGVLALLKNNIAGARAAYERAGALAPRSLDVLTGLLAIDFKTNNPAAAAARVTERLQQERTPDLLLLAGRTYWTARDPAAAEKVLREVIEKDPSLLAPYGMLGQIYVAQRKMDQARTEFEAMATRQTKPVGPLTMSGMILQAQGNVALAKKRFEEVLAIDPGAAIAANNLAWIHAESGEDLDTALRLAQTATAAAPDVPELMDTLGWVYYKKQLSQLAIPLFAKCVEMAPAKASYHYHLGLAYIQSGKATEGRAALQKAMATGADATEAADIRRILAAP
jgi:putative PEP-CTERM system TPR-repeat lipoprotein